MTCRYTLLSFLAAIVLGATDTLRAQGALTVAGPGGGAVAFTEIEGRWFWTGLTTPHTAEPRLLVEEQGLEIATRDRSETLATGWTLTEQTEDRVVLEQEAPETGLRVRRTFSFGAAVGELRIATWVRAGEGHGLLARIGLLDARFAGEQFRLPVPSAVPASFPVYGQSLFAGIEHVSGEAAVEGDEADRVRLMQRPRSGVGEEWQLVARVVVGWPVAGAGSGLTGEARMREAFLRYLDTVRIKPERMVLHTDTWWTVPLPLSEKNILEDIEAMRKGFTERTGLWFDTYCVDLGWSNPQTFWQMETRRFSNELRAVNDRLAALGGKMGLWMSPGSGYPDGLSNTWLQAQGYEMTPFGGGLGQVPCFALGGRYQREFKERVVAYARQYGLGHVILDFMHARCDVAAHGHPVGAESRYAIDAGLADVLDALRTMNPQMALEPMVCGYPPSPWWLMKTPFVLGPAGDDLPYGRGPSPEWLESLITARDVAYRAGQDAWIMPTQALETFDIIVQTPGDFQNTAVMAIGRGRWFLSTYFRTELMKPQDWDFFAALVRWARENKNHLVNAWQFGGKPENREAYGFVFRNPGRDLYCARNPWMEERTVELPAPAILAEPMEVRMIYPRRATVGRIEPGGRGLSIALAPYETAFFETVVATDATAEPSVVATPKATVAGGPPTQLAPALVSPEEEPAKIRYHWDGTISVPAAVSDAELCVLIEGPPGVEHSSGEIHLAGRAAEVRKVTSAGQFGAALDASPENWTWLIVPLAVGDTAFELEVRTQIAEAVIGVFVRGTVRAGNAPAPESGAVFPTYRADRRNWSQALQPLKRFTVLRGGS